MTSVLDFEAQFSKAMHVLAAGLPANAHVFVSSIPDIHQLWTLFHDDVAAELVWSAAGICQSMLALSNNAAGRQAVIEREYALNEVLANVCSQYAFCRFDGNATFNYKFSTGDVSGLDYFHPSRSGQAKLASLTWQNSWWAGS
ncbi:MAG TPA: hypothetical protein VFU26_05380 [Gaiellaceae bacterium]|nr:hypothetical protein [Gaiellaceae bacterium]